MRVTDALEQSRAHTPPPVQWAYPHEGTVLEVLPDDRVLVQLDSRSTPIVCRRLNPYAVIAVDGTHDHTGHTQPPPVGEVTALIRVLVVFPDGDLAGAVVIGTVPR